jgi:uncharacterized OsmC-like protein
MAQRSIAVSIGRVREFLEAHPDKGLTADVPATATIEDGLRVRVVGPTGQVLHSDMPSAVGGAGSALSPGWLLRAAHAACDATVIAMRAAEEGVQLTALEVEVGSDSDDRGLVGAGDDVPAGPLRTAVRIRIAADGVDLDRLHSIIDWAREHSPVDDALRRSVPIDVTIEAG